MPAIALKYLSYLFCALLLVLSFAQLEPAYAQEVEETNFDSTGFTSRVVAINGTIVECEGGLMADLANARISSLFDERKIRDLEIGLPIQVEGNFVPEQSSQSRTFFQATNVKALGLRKEIKLSASIQQIDSNRNAIKVLNHEVLIDANTKFLKQTRKRLKDITFAAFANGEEVTIEADMTETGLVARKVIKGSDKINGSQLIGFIRGVNGGVIEFTGGFVADVSRLLSTDFPELNPRSDLFVAVSIVSNINNDVDPLVCFAFSFSDPKNLQSSLLEQNLQDANAQARTIQVFNRVLPLTDDVKIFINGRKANISDLQIGKRTSAGLIVVDGNLMVNTIDQF